GAEVDFLAVVWPSHRGVCHLIAVVCDLHDDAEGDRPARQALWKLLHQEAGRSLRGIGSAEMLGSGGGTNAEAAVAVAAVMVRGPERRQGEERLSGEARRYRLGGLDELERLGMRAEELLDGRRLGRTRAARSDGAKQLEEIFAGPNRESVE